MFKCEVTRVYGIFVRTDNQSFPAGHIRLFSKKGPAVYFYHREVSHSKEWASRRIWNFYLFALHHISEGLSTSTPGWHVTWAHFRIKKSYRAINISWGFADIYTIPRKVKRTSLSKLRKLVNV